MKIVAALLMTAAPAFAQTWSEIDGSATGDGLSQLPGISSSYPSVAVDTAGNPLVAWEVDDGSPGNEHGSVYLLKWNGTAWVEVGKSASMGPGPWPGIAWTDRYA